MVPSLALHGARLMSGHKADDRESKDINTPNPKPNPKDNPNLNPDLWPLPPALGSVHPEELDLEGMDVHVVLRSCSQC